MADIREEQLFQTLLKVLYKRRAPVIAVFVLVVLFTSALWLLQPRSFEASFRFRYREDTPAEQLKQFVASNFGPPRVIQRTGETRSGDVGKGQFPVFRSVLLAFRRGCRHNK